jgi:hypothetical protein
MKCRYDINSSKTYIGRLSELYQQIIEFYFVIELNIQVNSQYLNDLHHFSLKSQDFLN